MRKKFAVWLFSRFGWAPGVALKPWQEAFLAALYPSRIPWILSRFCYDSMADAIKVKGARLPLRSLEYWIESGNWFRIIEVNPSGYVIAETRPRDEVRDCSKCQQKTAAIIGG